MKEALDRRRQGRAPVAGARLPIRAADVKVAAAAHGGAAAPSAYSDGCDRAIERAFEELARGADALEAAVEAAVVLEDDGRFNAGSGSIIRLDGRTVQMDAGVMDSRGRIGAVAAIERVGNPVRAARAVADTPHVLLAGRGAVAFARAMGLPLTHRSSTQARERYERTRQAIESKDKRGLPSDWRKFDWRAAWNFDAGAEAASDGCDTVGVAVRDARGRFAAVCSTGGASLMLSGRVGDSPIVGCGFYAGPCGAVVVTGRGEEIIKRMLARMVYDRIEGGAGAQRACEAGAAMFKRSIPVGVIAVDARGVGVCSNRDMPCAVRELQVKKVGCRSSGP